LTTWADFQLCLHRLLMSAGCKSSHNGFLDVSRSSGGLRMSGWIGQLSCLTIFSTSLSVAAFLCGAGGSMLESTRSHGRGILISRLISITFLLVFLTQPEVFGCLWYDNNRNVFNKGDGEVWWWLSMGRPKIVIMVLIWKFVGLTQLPFGPIFLMFIFFLTRVHYKTVLTLIISTSNLVRFGN